MKHLRTGLLSVLLMLFLGTKGQQNHFVYIQTENRQPFYVKLDKKLYSSSSTGYLVLSKLKQGTYNLAIGFPKNEWPEQNVPCTIQGEDLGYLLKNFGEKGWGLFNLQTMDIVMASQPQKTNITTAAVETKTDEFSNLLSSVVNDPTIKQVDHVPVAEAPAAPVQAEVQSDAALISQDTVNTVSRVEPTARSVVKKSFSINKIEGIETVYFDLTEDRTDTIAVLIPNYQPDEPVKNTPVNTTLENTVEDTPPAPAKENMPTIEYKIDGVKQGEPRKSVDESPKFIALELPDSAQSANLERGRTAAKETPVQSENDIADSNEVASNTAVMINSDCKSFASEEDFIKLRKKMVGEDNDDDMIATAKKSFKSRCFSVSQVKNLSVLFLKDEAKYAFFDMAYPFVSDSHNYSALQSQLTDTYYISRFQAMIRH